MNKKFWRRLSKLISKVAEGSIHSTRLNAKVSIPAVKAVSDGDYDMQLSRGKQDFFNSIYTDSN